jgi:hypothetical protein
VQEIWLAKDAILLCGDFSLKWRTVKEAMEYQEAWDDMDCLVRGTRRWEIWNTLKSRYGLAIHISQKRLFGGKLSVIDDEAMPVINILDIALTSVVSAKPVWLLYPFECT